MNKYSEIINMPHYEPKYHVRMSAYNRSSQFAPFAALTGYEELIQKANNIKINKKQFDDNYKEEINNILVYLKSKPNLSIEVIYYNKGKYINYIGNIKIIDSINKKIVFKDKKEISFEDILKINL